MQFVTEDIVTKRYCHKNFINVLSLAKLHMSDFATKKSMT